VATRRTLQRTALTGAMVSVAVLAASAPAMTVPVQSPAAASPPVTMAHQAPAGAFGAQAAPLPQACTDAIFKTKEKMPTTRYAIPSEVWNAMLAAVGNLTEAEQAELTEAACSAWNRWAAANGAVVGKNLDTRWQNAAAPACNKFAVATLGAVNKYSPEVPAATRRLEVVVKKIWRETMTKLSTSAADPACRTAYNKVKTGW
jgi:hypothetical protein